MLAGRGVVANVEVRGFPLSFSTTSRVSPRTTSAAGERTGSSTGPRTTRQVESPPSGSNAGGGSGAGADAESIAGADAEGATEGDAGADGGAVVSGTAEAEVAVGGVCPDDPWHEGRAARTSHHGARTPLCTTLEATEVRLTVDSKLAPESDAMRAVGRMLAGR